ncbi:MAG TPA: hypothetical protein VE999_10010 [Gemmataceae bacterium]|nr:hypothetical protein [Gemmataceae bacterium]
MDPHSTEALTICTIQDSMNVRRSRGLGRSTMVVKGCLSGLAALFIANSALACQGTTHPALDESFQNPDPGWGSLSEKFLAATPQGLQLRPSINGNAWIYNPNYKLDGADYCVQVTFPSQMPSKADIHSVGAAGMMFWFKDAGDYYVAAFGLDGTVQVARHSNGNSWFNLYYEQSAAVKMSPDATNEIELLISGDSATLFVNGTKLTSFDGKAPAGGGPPGLYAGGGEVSAMSWLFPRVRLYPQVPSSPPAGQPQGSAQSAAPLNPPAASSPATQPQTPSAIPLPKGWEPSINLMGRWHFESTVGDLLIEGIYVFRPDGLYNKFVRYPQSPIFGNQVLQFWGTYKLEGATLTESPSGGEVSNGPNTHAICNLTSNQCTPLKFVPETEEIQAIDANTLKVDLMGRSVTAKRLQ